MKRLRLPLLLLLASIQAGNVRAEVKAGPGLQTRVNGVMGGVARPGYAILMAELIQDVIAFTG